MGAFHTRVVYNDTLSGGFEGTVCVECVKNRLTHYCLIVGISCRVLTERLRQVGDSHYIRWGLSSECAVLELLNIEWHNNDTENN